MLNKAERPITAESFQIAANNYFKCLNLPPQNQVLIITDEIPQGHLQSMNDNLTVRTKLANEIGKLAENNGNKYSIMRYDGSKLPKNPSPKEKLKFIEQLKQGTSTSLNELDRDNSSVHGTTIVYLGDQWSNRTGIYAAADEFGKKYGIDISMAASLGFSTGDCRVMSNLDEKKMRKIAEMNKPFEKFFDEHKTGMFNIATSGEGGETFELNMRYDTSKAPFRSDLGTFDGEHESPLNEFKNVKTINVPGGEIYGSPYPFKETNGKFAAQGLVFNVEKGLITSVETGNVNTETLDLSQQELIKLVNERKQKMPVGELGIGFYKLLGIKTYKDSSVLSYEKDGPHIGLGHGEETTKEEEDEISRLAGDFRHTDFVLSKPEIRWYEVGGEGESQQFYPPAGREKLQPKSAAPLHDIFNLVCEILRGSPENYIDLLNKDLQYLKYFDELKRRVKKEKKSVRKFNETLNLLQVSQFPLDFDAPSTRYYGEINQQVRHILYLLTWGYYFDTTDQKISIFKVIKNYNEQLLSLAESMGKKSTKEINLAELADAIMKGNFDPSSLSRLTTS